MKLSKDLDQLIDDETFAANPYHSYEVLRASDPIHWVAGWNAWVVTRYEDVVELLRDPRLSSARMRVFREHIADSRDRAELFERLSHFMGMSDPPDHTRVKRAAVELFSRSDVERIRPIVEVEAESLLNSVLARGDRFDLLSDFARPLPARAIMELLGLPHEDLEKLASWAGAVVEFVSVLEPTPELARRADDAMQDLSRYFSEAIAQRMASPRQDAVTRLVAQEGPGRLSRDEILATCATLLSGGLTTTMNLIANGVLALLSHPHELERLRLDPQMLPSAVEELLRYGLPITRAWRVATTDITIGTTRIKTGDPVLLLVGSACRDPRQFTDPDELVLDRHPNRHVAFGFGPHMCVGAPLARMVATVAIETLLRRVKTIELDTPSVIWKRGADAVARRALQALPVRVTIRT